MIFIKYGFSLAKVAGLTGIDLLTWPPIDLCPSDPHRTARDRGAAWASEQGSAAPGLRRRSAGVRAIGRVGGSGASRRGQGASPWARESTRGLFGGGERPTGARDGLERRRRYSLRRRAIPGGGRSNRAWERILGVSHLGSQLQDKGAGSAAARRRRTAGAARGCAQREMGETAAG